MFRRLLYHMKLDYWINYKLRFWLWIAFKLPRGLVSACFVRVMTNATTGKYSSTVVPELTGMEALRRWEIIK